jgi:hypothetical protein
MTTAPADAIRHMDSELDGIPITRIESAHLRVDIAPSVGGRIVSLVEKSTGHEFLWRNASLSLRAMPSGSEYDPNFFGGIDELLPNDIPERIDGVDCPDHGELWTTPLGCVRVGDGVRLSGVLPLTGLAYEKELSLRPDSPHMDIRYRITNPTAQRRHFMWKLHAAMAVRPGDVIDCPARTGRVADPAWSRFSTTEPFDWPNVGGRMANIIPAPGNSCDFFYLSGLESGRMAWRRPDVGLEFSYEFDTAVFPCAWLFASYGGFDGHFTAILEPCTAMPISVNEAARQNQCSILEPGESLETTARVHAGPIKS